MNIFIIVPVIIVTIIVLAIITLSLDFLALNWIKNREQLINSYLSEHDSNVEVYSSKSNPGKIYIKTEGFGHELYGITSYCILVAFKKHNNVQKLKENIHLFSNNKNKEYKF